MKSTPPRMPKGDPHGRGGQWTKQTKPEAALDGVVFNAITLAGRIGGIVREDDRSTDIFIRTCCTVAPRSTRKEDHRIVCDEPGCDQDTLMGFSIPRTATPEEAERTLEALRREISVMREQAREDARQLAAAVDEITREAGAGGEDIVIVSRDPGEGVVVTVERWDGQLEDFKEACVAPGERDGDPELVGIAEKIKERVVKRGLAHGVWRVDVGSGRVGVGMALPVFNLDPEEEGCWVEEEVR